MGYVSEFERKDLCIDKDQGNGEDPFPGHGGSRLLDGFAGC